MKPSIRQLECFQAVVETGNFTRAAERMQTTQTNLSHIIKSLEDIVEGRLFDRTTRKVDLTAVGRAFAEIALPALQKLDDAVSVVQDFRMLKRGTVRIGAPPFLAASVLPYVIAIMAQRHPDLNVTVDDVSPDVILERMRGGFYELAVGSYPEGERDSRSELVVRDRLMAFMRPDHPLTENETLSWAQLAQVDIITMSRESGIRFLTEKGFDEAGLSLRPRFEVHQTHTALALAASGTSVAILPTYALAAVQSMNLVTRPVINPVISRDLKMIMPLDRPPSPATSATQKVMREVIRAMVPPPDLAN